MDKESKQWPTWKYVCQCSIDTGTVWLWHDCCGHWHWHCVTWLLCSLTLALCDCEMIVVATDTGTVWHDCCGHWHWHCVTWLLCSLTLALCDCDMIVVATDTGTVWHDCCVHWHWHSVTVTWLLCSLTLALWMWHDCCVHWHWHSVTVTWLLCSVNEEVLGAAAGNEGIAAAVRIKRLANSQFRRTAAIDAVVWYQTLQLQHERRRLIMIALCILTDRILVAQHCKIICGLFTVGSQSSVARQPLCR